MWQAKARRSAARERVQPRETMSCKLPRPVALLRVSHVLKQSAFATVAVQLLAASALGRTLADSLSLVVLARIQTSRLLQYTSRSSE